ncbi:40S ribosomal protein S2, putative [Ixodes scapularis]|uniref:40S ribosomal protein S2, putative n=1 Tax=Ixodes scapularis TaxID=6945 RepID=B7PWF0_IXOSC|nr:40S ribosomal protein S2, putative [Ixodes scapularis]|eukprot:XP_002409743.1 40S ribosomal protein S2, putative [Ixodes scapularis]
MYGRYVEIVVDLGRPAEYDLGHKVLGASAVGADGGRKFAAPDSPGYEKPDPSPAAVDLRMSAVYCLGHEKLSASAEGAVGLGVKCSKEAATGIREALILAKLFVIPVRRGYWGKKIGKPHNAPCKGTGRVAACWCS